MSVLSPCVYDPAGTQRFVAAKLLRHRARPPGPAFSETLKAIIAGSAVTARTCDKEPFEREVVEILAEEFADAAAREAGGDRFSHARG
jgi:hypothetical protein